MREVGVSRPISPPPPLLATRRATEHDIPAAVTLLARGFPERTADYWWRALCRLRDRSVPEGYPRYGYVVTDCGQLVGILLVIFASTDDGNVRGNVSSWYVDPAYRGFSSMLLGAPTKLKGATLVNISPAPNTIDTIRAQGFSQYVRGTFQTVAALGAPVSRARIRRIRPDDTSAPALLRDHAGWGCLSFEITHDDNTYPFVFVASRFFDDRLPCAQLVYCRDIDEFVRFAGPLGRRLLRHGLLAVMLDADGPLPALPGAYRAGRALRFHTGAIAPRLGDLSYTELAIFGP